MGERFAPLEDMVIDSEFWRDKRVFLTGHTGYKGSWLALWLRSMGAEVTGYALQPNTEPNMFGDAQVADGITSVIGDIRDREALSAAVSRADPQIVFHLAAQALVRQSYIEPVETHAINYLGTVNLLEAMRGLGGLRAAVMVTTDKVYRNREENRSFAEDDLLGGHDPYSASKAASEIAIASYRDTFFAERNVAIASARAGNVIGGGDWSRDRLIPDAVRAWSAGRSVQLRNKDATRPWQYVLEPLAGYLVLAQKLWASPDLAGAYNFGPNPEGIVTVGEVIKQAARAFGKGDVEIDRSADNPHEAGFLSLDNGKAKSVLGVHPLLEFEETLRATMGWYARYLDGEPATELCSRALSTYAAEYHARAETGD